MRLTIIRLDAVPCIHNASTTYTTRRALVPANTRSLERYESVSRPSRALQDKGERTYTPQRRDLEAGEWFPRLVRRLALAGRAISLHVAD